MRAFDLTLWICSVAVLSPAYGDILQDTNFPKASIHLAGSNFSSPLDDGQDAQDNPVVIETLPTQEQENAPALEEVSLGRHNKSKKGAAKHAKHHRVLRTRQEGAMNDLISIKNQKPEAYHPYYIALEAITQTSPFTLEFKEIEAKAQECFIPTT